MLRQRSKYIFYCLVVLVAAGCSRQIEPNFDDFGYNYFPLNVGDFRVYQVEQITFRGIDVGTDSLDFQLREHVVDSFINQAGGVSYKVERSTRLLPTDPWVLDSVWTARRDEVRAVSTENNTPFIKLVFPISEGKTWDGNKLNNAPCTNDLGLSDSLYCDAYEMVSIRENFELDTMVFENTITVIQQDSRDPLFITSDDVRKEVYQLDVGLVYKESFVVNYVQCAVGADNSCCLNGDLNPTCVTTVDRGLVLKQVLIDSGVE